MKQILIALVALAALTACGHKKTPPAASNNLDTLTPPPQPTHQATAAPYTPVPVVTTVNNEPGPGSMTQVLDTPSAPVATGPTPGQKYKIQAGDTLWNISTRAYGDGKQYKKITAANPSIKNGVIYKGQTITIPQ